MIGIQSTTRRSSIAIMRKRFVSCLAFSSLAGLTVAAQGCGPGHSRPSGHGDVTFAIAPSGESLVFNAQGDGGRDLYLLDLTTRKVTRVAATPDYEVDPDFAPDGKSLVYAAGQPGDRADHLFTRTLAGGVVRRLTAEPFNDASPAFSPDGSEVVFTRDKTYIWGGLASNWDEGGTLCMIKLDGTGLRELPLAGPMTIDPHFAPDARTILFADEQRLSMVAVDGLSPPRPLGSPAESSHHGVFAPDGGSIAFAAGKYSPSFRIYLAKPDGAEAKPFAAPPSPTGGPRNEGCFHPVFHPDGKRILCLVSIWPTGPTGDNKMALWEVDLATGQSREIADYTLFDDPLGWKPPGAAPVRKP